MGKNPAFQFYPSDWSRDLQEQPLEIEGAWIRICCRLWWADPPGSLQKPLKFWSDLMRIHGNKTLRILRHLDTEKVADISMENGLIRITSRRMVNDERIREIRRNAGILGGNPALLLDKQRVNQRFNQKPTPSSSSSSSSFKDIKQQPVDNSQKIQPEKLKIQLQKILKEVEK